MALPLILLPGAAWHVLRTVAWHQCFPQDARPTLGRAFRVRLAAEAFSFVTIRGLAGEPLKVLLLKPDVPPAVATAAVGLERLAYILVTAATVALGSGVALLTVPLSVIWFRIFLGTTVAGGIIAVLPLWLWHRTGYAASQPSRSTTGIRGAVREVGRQ